MKKEVKKYTESQAWEIWKAGMKYWETSGDSITFEELTEKMSVNRSKLILENKKKQTNK